MIAVDVRKMYVRPSSITSISVNSPPPFGTVFALWGHQKDKRYHTNAFKHMHTQHNANAQHLIWSNLGKIGKNSHLHNPIRLSSVSKHYVKSGLWEDETRDLLTFKKNRKQKIHIHIHSFYIDLHHRAESAYLQNIFHHSSVHYWFHKCLLSSTHTLTSYICILSFTPRFFLSQATSCQSKCSCLNLNPDYNQPPISGTRVIEIHQQWPFFGKAGHSCIQHFI